MTLTFYSNKTKPRHKENLKWMEPLIRGLVVQGYQVWHPALNSAPWHIQANINNYLVNFWPCAGKMQVDGETVRGGRHAVELEVNRVKDRTPRVDFDPIDDSDDFDEPA